jgi:radical SAM protein with 4Fe4S-binding SPASM domain
MPGRCYDRGEMGLLKRDIELRLDLTDRCNLRCIMCSNGYEAELNHRGKRFISIEQFRNEIGEILPRVNIINLSIGYEPLLNTDLCEILFVCRENNIPQVVMTTNLTLLTDKIAEVMTDGYVHLLHVSMDAGNKPIYDMIRRKGDFDRIVSNIKKINQLKMVKNSQYPNIVFNYVIMKINFEYLKEFIDFSNNLGIKEINCAELRIPHNYRKELIPFGSKGLSQDFDLEKQHIDYHLPEVKETLINLIKYAWRKGILLNVPYKFDLKIFSILSKERQQILHLWRKSTLMTCRAKIAFSISYLKNISTIKNAFCSFPWRQIVINPDGDVMPCCAWSGSPTMGNINNDPISRIWENENYVKVRKGLQNNDLPIACENCILSMKKRHGI